MTNIKLASIDVAPASDAEFLKFLEQLGKDGFYYRIVALVGPGGGNPNVKIQYTDRGALAAWLLTNYDPDMTDEDFALYAPD
jgi:hypothetical protein